MHTVIFLFRSLPEVMQCKHSLNRQAQLNFFCQRLSENSASHSGPKSQHPTCTSVHVQLGPQIHSSPAAYLWETKCPFTLLMCHYSMFYIKQHVPVPWFTDQYRVKYLNHQCVTPQSTEILHVQHVQRFFWSIILQILLGNEMSPEAAADGSSCQEALLGHAPRPRYLLPSV